MVVYIRNRVRILAQSLLCLLSPMMPSAHWVPDEGGTVNSPLCKEHLDLLDSLSFSFNMAEVTPTNRFSEFFTVAIFLHSYATNATLRAFVGFDFNRLNYLYSCCLCFILERQFGDQQRNQRQTIRRWLFQNREIWVRSCRGNCGSWTEPYLSLSTVGYSELCCLGHSQWDSY